MSIIPCSEECKFQIEGYCSLEKPSTVNSIKNDCPYFIPNLINKRNGLLQTGNPYEF